ncbi:MAG: U32 family peptidase C-terminal domain-containing protein [Syntrophobacteraceae bacterium]
MNQDRLAVTACKPELLAPGGSLEKCRIAFLYGADAVYVGGKQFSLRAAARNLDYEELAEASSMARCRGKKLYVTVNTFARNSDLKTLPNYLQYLDKIRVDGIIISDPALLMLARKWSPNTSLHLSTQANTTNSLSVRFWLDQGFSRVNLARELSMNELIEIRKDTNAELEVFVHGAMCVSYSGRCLLSAMFNNRSANRGLCTQPCRWSYRLVEEKRPGEYFPIFEDSKGTYIFNSKDLCLIEEIGALMNIGINAFKIEGRMKGALYLATVVRAYRKAIDEAWDASLPPTPVNEFIEELSRVSHRSYTKGFLLSDSDEFERSIASSIPVLQTHTLAGLVRPSPHEGEGPDALESTETRNCWTYIEVRSRLLPGAKLEFLRPDGSIDCLTVEHLEDPEGNILHIAQPNSCIRIPTPFPTIPLQVIRVSTGNFE